MGTRAAILCQENGKNVMAIYRQYDGYIRGGLGDDLKSILDNGKIGNGISGRPKLGEYFNGSGCLFATIISTLKDAVGNVYICPIDYVKNQGEEYIYTINVVGNNITLHVEDFYSGKNELIWSN
jgi:hypothetical protein